MKYFVRVGNDQHEVDIDGDTVTLDGRTVRARVEDVDGTPVRLVVIGERQYRVVVQRGAERGEYRISIDGYRVHADALDERTRTIHDLSRSTRTAGGATRLSAPMPGLIVRVSVNEGDEVRAGQGVVVMEAMKMENELRIGSSGRVKRIHVSPGTAVERGALLLEVE